MGLEGYFSLSKIIFTSLKLSTASKSMNQGVSRSTVLETESVIVGENIPQGTGHDLSWPCQICSGNYSSTKGTTFHFERWCGGENDCFSPSLWNAESCPDTALNSTHLTWHTHTCLACHCYLRTWEILQINYSLRSSELDSLK